jgi:hypothetical protein
MGSVHPVAGKEVDHDRPGIAQARLAEQLRGAEGQKSSHARRQRSQRPSLGGKLRAGIRVGRGADHDASSVFEFGQCGVESSGCTLGQNADADDADPGQSRCHRRG